MTTIELRAVPRPRFFITPEDTHRWRRVRGKLVVQAANACTAGFDWSGQTPDMIYIKISSGRYPVDILRFRRFMDGLAEDQAT